MQPANITSSSILDLPAARRQASPLSVEEYHRLGDGYAAGRATELLRGFVIEKMPRLPQHEFLVTELYELARAAAGSGLLVRKEAPLTLHDSEPEPDVAVVTGYRADYRSMHPATALLVIEIAITTEELDREKAALYAEADIAEYWLVLPERGLIEAHTAPRGGFYTRRQLYAEGESFASASLTTLRVELAQLFRA